MVKGKTYRRRSRSKTFARNFNKISFTSRKHMFELVDKPKKECNIIFIDENLAIKVIMDCRTRSAHKFTTRVRFKQYEFNLTK